MKIKNLPQWFRLGGSAAFGLLSFFACFALPKICVFPLSGQLPCGESRISFGELTENGQIFR
jgi:hypothetical protein